MDEWGVSGVWKNGEEGVRDEGVREEGVREEGRGKRVQGMEGSFQSLNLLQVLRLLAQDDRLVVAVM